MLENITENELEYIECFLDSQCLVECLFHNADSLGEFDEDKFGELRMYQRSMISHEYILDTDIVGLTKEDQFALRKGAGDLYCFGGRCFGKSYVVEILDMICAMLNLDGEESAFSSIDRIHIENILEKLIPALEYHPIVSLWKRRIKRNPFVFTLRNGHVMTSINMNLMCVDEETEILTDKGFQTYKTISKSDNVLSLNPDTDEATYEKISNIYTSDYDGDMYYTGGFTNFAFSPNHDIYYNWSFIQNWQKKPISNLNLNSNSQIYFKHAFKYNGELRTEPITFKIRQNNRYFKNVDIDFNVWLEFLGWYISEGCIEEKRNRIYISQSQVANPEKCKEIESVLRKMQVNYHKQKGKCFAFDCADMVKHLKKHCYKGKKIKIKTVHNCYNKKVPDYVKNLDSSQISIFLDSFRKGDGYTYKNLASKFKTEHVYYYTSSVNLANDLQELVLKTGKPSSCFTHSNHRKNDMHVISELTSKARNILLKNITVENYKGKLWCVETKPYGLIFIRRNGKCCWTGNSKSPGQNFYGKHYPRLYLEEASLESEEVHTIRKDSVAEAGCVLRVAGMTNFTKYSPAGTMFYDPNKQHQVLNLPQFVSPFWNEKKKEAKIEEYAGENSIDYKIFARGDIVEDGVSVFDMSRIRKACYPSDRNKDRIKNIEITTDNCSDFKNRIVVERPTNSEKILINADIGDGSISEIIIHSLKNKIHSYLYNITLFNLIDKEQTKIFEFLINELGAEVVGLDCGDGVGRSIYNSLAETYSKDILTAYDGSKKVQVDFVRDEQNKVQFKNGKPIYREEVMAVWSIKRLKDLLYEGLVYVPRDPKFDAQFNSVIAKRGMTRITYHCASGKNDHLFDAWKVFAIAQWEHEFNSTKSNKKKSWGLGV